MNFTKNPKELDNCCFFKILGLTLSLHLIRKNSALDHHEPEPEHKQQARHDQRLHEHVGPQLHDQGN